jgi:hypothetical protein
MTYTISLTDYDYQADAQQTELELEHELRTRAATLNEHDWKTQAVWQLSDALWTGQAHYYAREMWERLDSVEDGYASFLVCPQEVTCESVVGHRLLLEGLDAWREALEMLEQRPAGALKMAEYGNRILVTVQRYASQLQGGW